MDLPPVSSDRLDKIEHNMQHTPDDMIMAVFPHATIKAEEVRAMIAEIRRRRHKMGYTG